MRVFFCVNSEKYKNQGQRQLQKKWQFVIKIILDFLVGMLLMNMGHIVTVRIVKRNSENG